MAPSVFDLFTIGIGPSSSHCVGPMRAAAHFIDGLTALDRGPEPVRIVVELFGSLALTGKGHGTDRAILMGLEGSRPETIDPRAIPARLRAIRESGQLTPPEGPPIAFTEERDLKFRRGQKLPVHTNGLRISTLDAEDRPFRSAVYYSIGGGFVVDGEGRPLKSSPAVAIPFPFGSGDELLRRCRESGLPVSGVMLENEKAFRSSTEIREGLAGIWRAMRECVAAGLRHEGILPGGLKVERRAPALHRKLQQPAGRAADDSLAAMDWVNLWAIATNEENAGGGRVVTAPTNGAAGILPAVAHYYVRFCRGDDEGIARFLLTAAAIEILYKKNASISGAEVGCQGEVGVACSMAAAALTEVLGGSPGQVEQAAEIGMEHNLGLTCDPVGGLVQIPCIERNAMGAVKAINASRLALQGNGSHKISLDEVIRTMRQTGADMKTKYKETSKGGLAVNVVEC